MAIRHTQCRKNIDVADRSLLNSGVLHFQNRCALITQALRRQEEMDESRN